jgi:DNA-binding NarL/FixJ family response regulator
MFREALQAILEREGDMVIVGQSGEAAGALPLVMRVRPHVVLIGLNDRGDNCGLQLIRDIRASQSSVSIVVVTVLEDDAMVSEVIAAGAQGYVLKDVSAADLANAIRVVVDGGVTIDPKVASQVLTHWRLLTRGQAPSDGPGESQARH